MPPLPIPNSYKKFPGSAARVYDAICRVLWMENGPSGRMDRGAEVDWDAFTPEDWHLFQQAAETEGVGPLLFWHFRESGWHAQMPARLQTWLNQSYFHNVAHNALLFRELDRLLSAFQQAEIPVIVLKGAALANVLYEDAGLRPMSDLDLLVEEAFLDQALQIVQTFGYREAEAEISPGVNRQVAHNAYWRGGPEGRVGLEIHWNLIAGKADDRAVPVDWFWGQLEQVSGTPLFGHRTPFFGHPLPHLCPTAHLLYLAAHLMLRHGGTNERLIWYYDAGLLIRDGQVDWAVLAQQAQTRGWGALVRYVLEGTAARFGTPIPDGLVERLSGGAAWLAFLDERSARAGHFSRLEQTWDALQHLSWPVQLRMMVALCFPAPAYLRWRYHPEPPWIWPFYYLVRWGDVGKEVGGWVLARRRVTEGKRG